MSVQLVQDAHLLEEVEYACRVREGHGCPSDRIVLQCFTKTSIIQKSIFISKSWEYSLQYSWEWVCRKSYLQYCTHSHISCIRLKIISVRLKNRRLDHFKVKNELNRFERWTHLGKSIQHSQMPQWRSLTERIHRINRKLGIVIWSRKEAEK